VNTLPLRVQIAGELTLAAWLERVGSAIQELQLHAHSSLVAAHAHTNVPRGRPLFEAIVAFQNYPAADGAAWSELAIEAEPRPLHTDYPLTIIVEPGQALRLRFTYQCGRLSDARASQLAEHLRTAIIAVPTAVNRPVAEWPILHTAERRRIVESWSRGATYDPGTALAHEYVAEMARRSPSRIALEMDSRTLTYEELNGTANQLAHWLQRRGAGPDRIIAIHAERSIELVVAALAILKAGAAFLPLSTEDPPARVQRVVQQAKPVLILTQARLRERAQALGAQVAQVAELDGPSAPWRGHSSADPLPSATGLNLAYVIATSGSTGEPKLVMNTHEGLQNRITWGQRAYPLDAHDRVLQKTPCTFDVSVWEMLWPLMFGARLVIAAPAGHRDPTYIAEAIARHDVSVVHFVPTMLQLFLEQPDLATRCRHLRLVVTSGEALTSSQRDRLFEQLPASLLNLYGPAEAAIEVSHWPCQPDQRGQPVPIGRPIDNTSLYVLDESGELCPAGIAGELCIAGLNLARGYLGRPDLTAERFVPDPFSKEPGRRVYRTGDLARYTGEGVIEYLGRKDFQVKLHGQRIELAEVEEALRGQPGVRNAVVVAMGDSTGGQRLVAYVAGARWEAGELRSGIGQRLPAYMVPSLFVPVDALPLTASGKLDRKALPALDQASLGGSRRPFVAPRDLIEDELAQLWREILEVERVGAQDHFFFDLGGHSLMALRLLSRVGQTYPVRVSLAEFLREPTVSALAGLLRGADRETARQDPLVPIQPKGQQRPLFLAPPALGLALVYQDLARALGRDQPLYAFQAPGLEDATTPIADARQLASQYLAAVRSVQPAGPYLIGGYSYGGLVAFAMADQLAAAGETVERLFIFDTLAPAGQGSAPEIDPARLLLEVAEVLARYTGKELSLSLEQLRAVEPEQQLRQVHAALLTQGVFAGVDGPLQLDRLVAVERAAIEALAAYRPNRCEAPVELIRCTTPTRQDMGDLSPERFAEPTFGWKQWCAREINVHWVESDHLALMRPPAVSHTAAIVAQVLGQIASGSPGP
jgi:amino acid adenylation domain-containing protein